MYNCTSNANQGEHTLYSEKIIDVHAHIFPGKVAEKAAGAIGEFYGISMRHNGTVETLLESGGKIGVRKFIVHSTATRPEQVDVINNFVAENVKRYPDKLIGFGTLHRDLADPEDEIARIISIGLKGIKLHPDFQLFNIDDPKMMPIFEMFAGKLPVLIHAGDDRYEYSAPRRIANVARTFPNLTVIAAHFGGYNCWQEVECYKGLDNVYFDTSSSLFKLDYERARYLISNYGVRKFMFGVDFPMWDHEEELERYKKLGFSEEDNELILYKNAEKLFGI